MNPTDLEIKLMALGINSELAHKAVAAGYSLTRIKSATYKELEQHFSDEEATLLHNAGRRKPIDRETINRLVEECDWKCCLCWSFDKSGPIVIHHIEEHSRTQDDHYDNLILLCPNHHAEAHSSWEISRHPCPPEVLRSKKGEWIKALRDFKAGLRPAPGREPTIPSLSGATAPAPPQAFTGRNGFLTDLMTQVGQPPVAHFALAIQGMGGVGKTATAKKLAAKLTPLFPCGVLWTSLADSVGEPISALTHWYRSCGYEPPASIDATGMAHLVRRALAERTESVGPLLAVIDDVRTEWLDAAKLLRSALPEGVSLIVTVRDAALALALDTTLIPLDTVESEEGVEILAAYAGKPVVEKAPDAASDLVSAVGGLPLALELAGKRITLLARKPGNHIAHLCSAIRERAETALTLPGHTGLSATFLVTYDALGTGTRRLFRSLGIFAEAPIEAKAVAALLKTKSSDAAHRLDELVQVAFLSWNETDGEYRLHPLLHQFARDLLESASHVREAKEARKRHLNYYLAEVEAYARPELAAYLRLEQLMPNIARAMDTARELADPSILSRFAEALHSESDFLMLRGHVMFGRDLLSEAAAKCRAAGDRRMEAVHTGNLATLLFRLGELDESLRLSQDANRISGEIGDVRNQCVYVGNCGLVYTQLGQIDLALAYHHEAHDLSIRSMNEEVYLAQLGSLASLYRAKNDLDRSAQLHDKAIKLARRLGDRLSESNSLSNLGLLYVDIGDDGQAETLFNQALLIAREIGDLAGEGNRLGHLGGIRIRQNRLDEALTFTESAIHLSRCAQNRVNEGEWLGNKGIILTKQGRATEGQACLEAALEIAQGVGSVESELRWKKSLLI